MFDGQLLMIKRTVSTQLVTNTAYDTVRCFQKFFLSLLIDLGNQIINDHVITTELNVCDVFVVMHMHQVDQLQN